MSGMISLFRPHKVVSYEPLEQKQYINLQAATDEHNLDYVFVADDSEWDSSHHKSQDIELRTANDIISHQYVIKYSNYPALGIVIFRNENDSPFCFWDLLSVVRFYLHEVGYREYYLPKDYRRLARQLRFKRTKVEQLLDNSYRVPPICWTGFFSGVDLTAYCDWHKYLDTQLHSKTDPHFVTLNKQEFFSSNYSILITNPNSRKAKYPVTIKFTDTMALGPQGGLAALGSIVGQPKLNTKKWDLEDDLIAYRQYANPSDGGYYKSHMRYLLDKRPNDYFRYALGDSEVTLKYLNFILGNVIDITNKRLIHYVHIPATLTSLADEISSTFSQLPFDQNTVQNIYDNIFQNMDINNFLRPIAYNQAPLKDQSTWQALLVKVVSGECSPADPTPFSLQKVFIEKLKPYLARGSIIYHVSKSGYIYPSIVGSAPCKGSKEWSIDQLQKMIDYQRLYKDNPDFDITQLENQQINSSKPKIPISTLLRNQYADHAHQFNYTKNNVPPTIDELIPKLHDDSVYKTVSRFNHTGTIEWSPIIFLAQQLNFDKMRKGYDFTERSSTDSKHKKGEHDQFSVRPDSVYNDGFDMAKHAYVGGMNLSFNSGLISNKYKYKYDIDLKSSYVNAGLLIPDFRLDTKPLLDTRDIDNFQEFYQQNTNLFPNGPFTIGVGNVSYHFPDNVKRVPVGYKPPIKGQGPVYVRQANRVDMTLTDIINIIKHGGNVRVHRLIIPQQKALNGNVNQLAPIGRMQYWSLSQRNQAKKQRNQFPSNSAEYRKFDSLQLFYKLLGNGGYGKSGQGLGTSGTRDFLTGMSMYVPFSRNTNPFTAAQYTSIARYQVNALMDLVEKVYPNSLIPSVTTDGFIFCSNALFDEKEVQHYCEQNLNSRWVGVNHLYFNDQYFELKSHNVGQKFSTQPLYNIRTRFNMTPDNHIKALVGLRSGEWYPKRLINMINHDTVTFKVEDSRMQSLNDMKHSTDHKHYTSMRTWQQPKYLNLSPDDTYEPIGFVQQGDFYYFLTRPFSSIEELLTFKAELAPYRKLFPAFRLEYAKAFMSLDRTIHTYTFNNRKEKHVGFVHDDVPLRNKPYPQLIGDYKNHYAPSVMLRFIANHQEEYDLKGIYQQYFTKRFKRFSGFKQAVKRNVDKFVNPLCVIKEGFIEQLKKYEIN